MLSSAKSGAGYRWGDRPIERHTGPCGIEVQQFHAVRELYTSPNGDRWFFRHDPKSGHAIVRHEGNAASGGNRSEIAVRELLGQTERHPGHWALLRLLGTSARARDVA